MKGLLGCVQARRMSFSSKILTQVQAAKIAEGTNSIGLFEEVRTKIQVPSTQIKARTNTKVETKTKTKTKLSTTEKIRQSKQGWLCSLQAPSWTDLSAPGILTSDSNMDGCSLGLTRSFVIGIDPDVHGAIAILSMEGSKVEAQVIDSPSVDTYISGRLRRRLDAGKISTLLKKLGTPPGTIAYVEQGMPLPLDGKQGWWSTGFNYGLWIGCLVGSGISVIPVPSNTWKSAMRLKGDLFTKDDSRALATSLFPSLSPQLTRKKDHGRAEALLIATFGKDTTRMGLLVEDDKDQMNVLASTITGS